MAFEPVLLDFTNNSSIILANNSTILLNTASTLDSSWIFSVFLLLFSIYGVLDEQRRRNIFYMLGIWEYLLVFSVVFLIYVTIAHYSVTCQIYSELMSFIPNLENPLITFSYIYGIAIILYFGLHFKNRKLRSVNPFIDNLLHEFIKQNYSTVSNDLESYFDELYDHYINPENFVFKKKFERFLNIVSDEEEFVFELCKKYPYLAYQLLDSPLNFDKSNYWTNYSKYLFLNKNSEVYAEITQLLPQDYYKLNYSKLELDYEDTFFLKSIFDADYDTDNGVINVIAQYIRELEVKLYSSTYFDIEQYNSPIYAALMFYDLKIKDGLLYGGKRTIDINPVIQIITTIILSMENNWKLNWYYKIMETYLNLIFKLYKQWISFSKKDTNFGISLISVISSSFWEVVISRLNHETKNMIYRKMDELLNYIDKEFEEEIKNIYFESLFDNLNSVIHIPEIKKDINLENVKKLYYDVYDEFK
ncbi:hypothetical protein HNP89_001914 [Methanococcus maripaludis]|uniref:Uncharacterized protein n=1 Tax=Methanococcus maripaludis TaxID=39152 RepID=A0A7J9P742_METMI|nr:hypothetical protein [Methanococcus maripaludis]MBA2853936.1 hypothetical protein [Methanococcus maripaludis]